MADDENKNLSRLSKLEMKVDKMLKLQGEFKNEKNTEISELEKKIALCVASESVVHYQQAIHEFKELEKHWTRQQEQLDNLEMKYDQGHGQRIEKLEASSASHTEKIKEFKKGFGDLLIDEKAFVVKEIDELKTKLVEFDKIKATNFVEMAEIITELKDKLGKGDKFGENVLDPMIKAFRDSPTINGSGDKLSLIQQEISERFKEKPPEYRGKPVEERRANYESRKTSDGVPIHKILEKPPEEGYKDFVEHYEGYWKKKYDKLKEKPPEDDFYKVKSPKPKWIPKDIDDYFRQIPNDLPRIKYARLLEAYWDSSKKGTIGEDNGKT